MTSRLPSERNFRCQPSFGVLIRLIAEGWHVTAPIRQSVPFKGQNNNDRRHRNRYKQVINKKKYEVVFSSG